MRQISEVLRLSAQGFSLREISRSVGISPATAGNYLDRARRAGVGWPLPPDLDGGDLEARLFVRPEEATRPGRPVPDWAKVHRERRRGKHVTLQLLWLEYKEVHPDGWGYTQFCRHYHQWLGRQDVVLRFEHADGERLFVDFAGDTVPVTDPETGEVWPAQIFVAVLGASGYLYAEAVRHQDLPSWLGAHVRALSFYGGAPRILVPDNLKAGVTRACWYDPDLNPSYLDLARHFNLAILPTRPHHPRDKAAVEVGVQVAERWVLAPLRHRRFFSLGELNAAIAEQVRQVNDRPFRGQALSRRALFEASERAALQPLPITPYALAWWKATKVNVDYHVEYDHHGYSVPHRLVREAVDMRATASTIEVFHKGRRVASHVRAYGRQRFVTDPAHMPAAHRAHLEWTPSRLLAWATSMGPDVGTLVEAILASRPHPEHGYRACLGLMRLGRRYGPERLVAACQRALATGSTSYRGVEAILKHGLDRVPVSAASAPISALPHANLRGPAYYQQLRLEA